MRVFTGEEMRQTKGRFILEYGKTGVGKSLTTLLTAPAPIFLLQTENRNLEPTLDCVRQFRPDLISNGWLDIGMYDNFADTLEFLSLKEKDLDKYRTILGDSLTDLMAVKLPIEIQNEVFDAKKEEEKKVKQLITQSKLTLEGYGGLSAQTLRLTNTIARYTRDGKYVIFTARLDENPSWARHYNYAPLLKGREYGKDFEGMFDLIGYVQTLTKETEDGSTVIDYPPGISFASPNGNFMAKWTGPGDRRDFRLNWSKILGVSANPE